VQQPANFPCPKPIANQLCDNGQSLPVGQLCPSTPATTSVPVPTAPPGVTVTYAAGWNIVAGPSGTTVTGASGSVYTLQPGDASYETLPSGGTLKPGAGYLADFAASTTATLPMVTPATVSVQLPPGQFVLIGNPGNTNATVTGAGTVLVFNPTTSAYTAASTLAPGTGAWAESDAGGQITITNAPS